MTNFSHDADKEIDYFRDTPIRYIGEFMYLYFKVRRSQQGKLFQSPFSSVPLLLCPAAGFTKFQLVDVVLVVALVAKTFWNDFHFNDFFYRRDYTVLCPAVYILFIFTWQLIFCLVHLNPLLMSGQ